VDSLFYFQIKPIPKSNRKIVEKGKIDTSNTQTHGLSLSWLGTDSSIKGVGG
jgi:hypothetical protein